MEQQRKNKRTETSLTEKRFWKLPHNSHTNIKKKKSRLLQKWPAQNVHNLAKPGQQSTPTPIKIPTLPIFAPNHSTVHPKNLLKRIPPTNTTQLQNRNGIIQFIQQKKKKKKGCVPARRLAAPQVTRERIGIPRGSPPCHPRLLLRRRSGGGRWLWRG